MAKPNFIELPDCEPIPILYEDRSALAIDKPPGWMLAPVAWQNTSRNLQAAIESSIAAHDFWARSRGLKFLRHVHRLDADTSGVLLFAKSPGAVKRFFDLFEGRRMEKTYLAVVVGELMQAERGRLVRVSGKEELAGGPPALLPEWTCRLKLAPDKKRFRKMKVDSRYGKNAETHFKVLETRGKFSLIEARPITGRTHQIRVHLAESGLPIVGDDLYGREEIKTRRSSRREEAPISLKHEPRHLGCYEASKRPQPDLGLRAVRLAYVDPFSKKRVDIHAPTEDFLKKFGF